MNFILIFDNPTLKLIRQDQLYSAGLQEITFQSRTGGLLRSTMLHEVHGYVRQKYNTLYGNLPIGVERTVAHVTPKYRFQLLHNVNPDTELVGFMSTNSSTRYNSSNQSDNRYELCNLYYESE